MSGQVAPVTPYSPHGPPRVLPIPAALSPQVPGEASPAAAPHRLPPLRPHHRGVGIRQPHLRDRSKYWPPRPPGGGCAHQGPCISWAMRTRGCVWGGTGMGWGHASSVISLDIHPETTQGMGHPPRDHAGDGTRIQGWFTGWDTHPGATQGVGHPPRDHAGGGTPTQGLCEGQNVHLGLTHQLGHPRRGHSHDVTRSPAPWVLWGVPPGPRGVGAAPSPHPVSNPSQSVSFAGDQGV